MPFDSAVSAYQCKKLQPLYNPQSAREVPVNLAPNTVFLRGTVLGQVSASTNDVQTLTITGAPTGGTITVVAVNPLSGSSSRFDLPFNATAAAAQTAARSQLGANINVTGGPLPASPLVFTAAGAFAALPIADMSVATNALSGGNNPTATFSHTTVGRSAGTFAAYNDANTDGTQIARAVLSYDCSTDASSNVSFGTAGANVPAGRAAPAYISGYFSCAELIGLDANAVVDLGRIVSGTIANGVLSIS